MAAGAVAGDSTSQVLAQQNEPPVAQLYQLRSENRQLELENRQLKAQNSQLEAQVASLNDEVAKQRLLGIPNTLAALPPASSPSSRSSRPPSYAGSTVRTATTYGPTEGAPRSQDTVSQPSLLQPESLDADPGLLAKMLAGLAGLEVTNAKNQLQEWCMRLAKRYPLPDYVSACDKHYWRCTVTVRDLEGELVLAQQGPSAATQKDAQMAAAEQAMRVILASEAGSCDNAREASAPAPAAHLTTHMGAKNQLQEWCMSPSRRHPLPDYGECRPAPSGAGWESTVKIFDLQGQLILQESATAATKREAEMAAAHSALSSIH
mmetsp:Transcript_27727/g.63748  ORF Transcript_27727/g.63748 Transcript_27727/m.63748 type:complete len:320 (-) Transcript_27727:1255-2214(-)